ncbi:hypothetical protein RclHR1_16070004 [Rhizophagus clarus]|uniref:Uncharacterized protein n=1 Tax=Rhizophagus clarus TaxID=94130 RepID=A0A2Z6R9L2_9GLOM|nr:hypothetical protein RclHR1_16070004 [Rhizophagus clarus]
MCLASNRRNNDESKDNDGREKDDGREDEKEKKDRKKEKSGSSDNDNDDHDRDKMNMTDDKIVNLDEPIPVGFKNNLKICNFLVTHPHILHLANKMLEMDSGSGSTSLTSSADVSAKYIYFVPNSLKVITGSLSNKEIKDYIDEHFVQKLLNRQLAAVNLSEMKKIGSFDTLIDFIRETFKVSWNGKDLSVVKNLDSMTKDIIIPFRSGNRII